MWTLPCWVNYKKNNTMKNFGSQQCLLLFPTEAKLHDNYFFVQFFQYCSPIRHAPPSGKLHNQINLSQLWHVLFHASRPNETSSQIAERHRAYSLTHSLFLRLLNNSWIKQNTTNTLRCVLPSKLIPQNEIELYLAAQIEAITWY